MRKGNVGQFCQLNMMWRSKFMNFAYVLHFSKLINLSLFWNAASRRHSLNGEDGPDSAQEHCTCVYTAVVSADAWRLDAFVVHDVGSFLGATDGQATELSRAMSAWLSSVVLYAGVQGKRTDSHKRSSYVVAASMEDLYCWKYCLVPTTATAWCWFL